MAEASENAMYRVPVLEKARIARGWAGLYEISPDHHAILGRVPEVEGFILANGFSGHGFQHSPAVGKVICGVDCGREGHHDRHLLPFHRALRKGRIDC